MARRGQAVLDAQFLAQAIEFMRPGRCPRPALEQFTQGGLGEAVTRRIAIGTFAMSMLLGSNTIRRNALRLLLPTRAEWLLVKFIHICSLFTNNGSYSPRQSSLPS